MVVALDDPDGVEELGVCLAPAIHEEYVQAIVCTAECLEADLFMLLAREQCPTTDSRAWARAPAAAWSTLIDAMTPSWESAHSASPIEPITWIAEAIERLVAGRPYLRQRRVDSWVCAAVERRLPVWVVGWADSRLGATHAEWCHARSVDPRAHLESARDSQARLSQWARAGDDRLGLLRIGTGPAGDLAASALGSVHFDCAVGDGPFDGRESARGDADGRIAIQCDPTVIAPILLAYVMGG